jgi:glycopeptide antibiotics resistance protein
VALIIIATLLPFGGMTAERIPPSWCLQCGTLWLTDAFANIALFVPFGLAMAMRRHRVWQVLVVSLCFSLLIELLQSVGFPPGRSPALADIVTNTLGGTLGAALSIVLVQERTRTARTATWLAIAWTMLAMSVFALTARALQQVEPVTNARFTLSKSPFGHVPGHGWYEGVTDSAAVNDTIIRRGWSGPIILSATPDVLPVRAAVWVHSTDPLGGQIPLLFVHQRGDSAAWLQIAKLGNDAELVVMRRAWTWGLTFPSVVVPGVFLGRAVGDTSTVALSAHVTPAVLSLQRGQTVSTLRLTPLLGWSLVQPVFTVQSGVRGFAQLSWVWLWVFPIAWWARRGTRPSVVMAALSVVVVACLAVVSALFGLSPLSPLDWAAVLSGLAYGAIVSRSIRPSPSGPGGNPLSSTSVRSSATLSEASCTSP